MGVDVNFALLGNAPDAGQAFMQGMDQGRARRKQQETENALKALGSNPDDPNAVNALMQIDTRLGLQYRQQQVQFQEAQRKREAEGLEQHREAILAAGKLLRQMKPQDEAGWQQFRAIAGRMGLPVDQAPPNFDPQYVQGLIQAADVMDPQKQERPRYFAVPPGGRLELDPSYTGPGAPQQGQPPAGTPELPPGWVIEDDGGAGQPGPQTFP